MLPLAPPRFGKSLMLCRSHRAHDARPSLACSYFLHLMTSSSWKIDSKMECAVTCLPPTVASRHSDLCNYAPRPPSDHALGVLDDTYCGACNKAGKFGSCHGGSGAAYLFGSTLSYVPESCQANLTRIGLQPSPCSISSILFLHSFS